MGSLGMTAKDYGVSFWRNQNVPTLIVVIVAQLSENTKKQYVNDISISLSLNKSMLLEYTISFIWHLS